jgi:two-component system response regulator RegX3
MAEDSNKTAILVVEDEKAIRQGLCDALAYHGYAPTGVETGEDGLREALTDCYALILLDLMLPVMSGFDVCSGVREALPDQAILLLTARGSEGDILEGFERGADDYVTKPFSVSELLARVAALVRRSGGGSKPSLSPFSFGPWEIDPAALRAERGEGVVDLSPRELEVLQVFAREQGRIVSRRMLLQEVWGFANPERIETRTVDMQIVKLRRKIDRDGVSLIETVRGAGYRYAGGT